jgi:triacylglycerol lipase
MAQLSRNQHYLRNALCLAYVSRAAYERKASHFASFAALGWESVVDFERKKTGTQGFVARNAEHVVLAFRGTEPDKVEDFITNVSYRHHVNKVHGGRVHEGFWNAWQSVRELVVERLATARDQNQLVWFTGHSLGGAIATLAGRDVPAKSRPMTIHTFGSPRVGDPAFASKYRPNLMRFVNEDDIVPHLPMRGLINRYKHVGRAHILRSDGRITSAPSAWRRLLRRVAQMMIFGVGSLPPKAIADHSMDRYIAKLEQHPLNK